MNSGPIKAEDISDELHDKIMQLLLRKALGKQGMADILNAAIEEVVVSPAIFVAAGDPSWFITSDDEEYYDLAKMGAITHWKGEKI